jgi:hypothetical protein
MGMHVLNGSYPEPNISNSQNYPNATLTIDPFKYYTGSLHYS